MRAFFVALTRNLISLLGVAITTASALLIISLFAIELFGFLGNPYIGILAYMVLPGIFVLGLVLIPIGVVRQRRRDLKRGTEDSKFPVIDLNLLKVRKWVLIIITLTSANLVILAVATFKGVEFMESTEFCGEACHSVMHPELVVYRRSPHARVACVDCHIGPGADWFVKSKLSGAWQVVSVSLDLYPRPIPTPVHDLRPARETCEQCHWPTKFVGDQFRTFTHYENDEASTEVKSVMMLHVGGQQEAGSHGIHWHVDPDVRIRFRSDESRQQIHEVELTDEDGTVQVFRKDDPPAEDGAEPAAEWRTMDCVDCHNRPTHVYRPAEEEIDAALAAGRISRELPFVRREGLAALKVTYASAEEARTGLSDALSAYYHESHPEIAAQRTELIEQAGVALAEIYNTNVFPSMNITWGTYPNFIGHQHFDGCFRCHDDEHVAEDGEVISQDCFTCHTLLAVEEEDPEILGVLQP